MDEKKKINFDELDTKNKIAYIVGILLAIALIPLLAFIIYYGSLSLLVIVVFGIMGIFTTIGQITGKGKK